MRITSQCLSTFAAVAGDAATEYSAAAPAQLQVNAYTGEEEGGMHWKLRSKLLKVKLLNTVISHCHSACTLHQERERSGVLAAPRVHFVTTKLGQLEFVLIDEF